MLRKSLAVFTMMCILFSPLVSFAKGVSVRVSTPSVRTSSFSAAKSVSVSTPKTTVSTKAASVGIVTGSAKQSAIFTPPSNKQTATMWGATKTAPTQKVAVVGNKNAYASKIPNTAMVKQGFAGTSVFDKSTAQQMKYQRATNVATARNAEISKFQTKTEAPKYTPDYYKTDSTFKNYKVSGNPSTWKRDRNNYYSRTWRTTPNYVYVGSPYYGNYDAMFMWMMLDSVNDAAMMSMMYNRGDSAEFKQWREHAEKAAAADAEVAAKLKQMDEKIATMSGDKNPNYVPAGVPVTAMYSQEVLQNLNKELTEVRIDTGSEQGVYHAYEQRLATAGKDSFKYVERSEPNLMYKYDRYMKGESDMFMAPLDALNVMIGKDKEAFLNKTETTIPMYKEIMVMLTSWNSSVDKMTDIDDDAIVIAGTENSGTDITWRKIAKINENYEKAKIVNMSYNNPDDPMAGVFTYLKNNKNAVVIFQGGLNSAFLKKAEAKATEFNLRIVNMNDDDVASITGSEGDAPVYTEVSIPDNYFINLQKGWFFTHDKTAYVVDAVMVISKSWAEKNGADAVDEVVEDTVLIQSDMQKFVNGFEI